MKKLIFATVLILTACANPPVNRFDNRPTPPIAKSKVKPLKVEQPCFPMRAIRTNAEGWVQVEFSLNEQGRAVEITSVDDSPPGLFQHCALKSIKKWVFEVPQTHQQGNRYQFVFEFKLG